MASKKKKKAKTLSDKELKEFIQNRPRAKIITKPVAEETKDDTP